MAPQVGAALGEDQARALGPAVERQQHRRVGAAGRLHRRASSGVSRALRGARRPSTLAISRRDLDDHLDGAAVDGPGGAGDVGGALGAEEDDRGGDLVDLGEAADRALGAGGLERLLAAVGAGELAATGRAGRPAPSTARTSVGPGADRVDEDAVAARSGRRRGARARARPPWRPSTRASPPRAACRRSSRR